MYAHFKDNQLYRLLVKMLRNHFRAAALRWRISLLIRLMHTILSLRFTSSVAVQGLFYPCFFMLLGNTWTLRNFRQVAIVVYERRNRAWELSQCAFSRHTHLLELFILYSTQIHSRFWCAGTFVLRSRKVCSIHSLPALPLGLYHQFFSNKHSNTRQVMPQLYRSKVPAQMSSWLPPEISGQYVTLKVCWTTHNS